MIKTREIKTWYSDANEAEHDITVTVSAAPENGLNAVEISTDLPEMPAAERCRLTERAAELYWEAEHHDYACSPAGERAGL